MRAKSAAMLNEDLSWRFVGVVWRGVRGGGGVLEDAAGSPWTFRPAPVAPDALWLRGRRLDALGRIGPAWGGWLTPAWAYLAPMIRGRCDSGKIAPSAPWHAPAYESIPARQWRRDRAHG